MKKIYKSKKIAALITSFIIFIVGATVAFASWGSSAESTNCYGQNCRTWHNNGYTHSQYPNGVDFATFNGYKDATKAGRSYEEMQFMYIESVLAPLSGFPLPTPWESWSNYNFATGDSHQINFSGDPDEKVRVGFWAYIHNNGVADLYPANGTKIKISGWSSSTPKSQYNPRYDLWASNTKPRNIWSNVTLTGNQPFTLTPKEAYISREEGDRQFNAGQLQSITHDGIYVKSNSSNASGRIDSSELHYVLIYVEFEATPEIETPKECRSLEIVRPTEANDGQSGSFLVYPTMSVGPDGFVNEPLEIRVDSDPGVISRYQYFSHFSQAGIQFGEIPNDPNQSGDIFSNQTTVYMNGLPGEGANSDDEMVWVAAVDDEDIWIGPCGDALRVVREDIPEGPECALLETIPPKNYTEGVPTNELIEIEIDTLIDTEGNDYLVNGNPPLIRYCSTRAGDVDFFPTGYEESDKCVVAPATVKMSVIAYTATQVTIEVVGAEDVCDDAFKTRDVPDSEEECLDLDINQADFEADDSTYSVSVETDPEDADYRVEWTVEDSEGDPYNNFPVTLDSNEIDLDNYNYTFTPGDSLHARVVDLYYEDEVCEDMRDTEEEICTEFELDTDRFERGTDQEICVEDTDWPYFDELEYETSDGETGTVDVDSDDCFILEEEVLEDADWIDIWIPEWEDDCRARLERFIEPPDFDKNVKDQDGVGFSSRAVANFSDSYVDYRITYDHKSDEEQNVVITDTIGRDGYIQGYIANDMQDIRQGAQEGGRIYYAENTMRIEVGGSRVFDCDDVEEDLCYEGSIGDARGVEIFNVPERTEVVITYRGEIVDSEVNPANCSDPNHIFNQTGICGELYPNVSEYEDDTHEGSDDAEVLIPCPYLIIRAGGDVYFENPLDYGADTLYCADIANVDVPIIKGEEPTPPDIVAVGPEQQAIPTFTHRLCKTEEAVPGYEDIKGISSLICEVSLQTSEQLTRNAIVQNIENNKQRVARYAADSLMNTGANVVVSGQSQLERDYPSRNNVYYKNDGSDLILDNGSANVEFTSGARTFVVEDGDVYIESNMVYADEEVTDPRNVASIAIIVLNGNIIVSKNVTETSGVLFVQAEDPNTGKLCQKPVLEENMCDLTAEEDNSNAYADDQLIHYGSIYGDIEHLFKFRTFVGDPTREEGAVVIRFDNRIFNTPPILNELVDVTQYVF